MWSCSPGSGGAKPYYSFRVGDKMEDVLKKGVSKKLKYDEHEASRLLSDAAEEFVPDKQGRRAAAFKLLQQLVDLCTRIGIRSQCPQYRLEKMAQIANDRGGAVAVLLEEDGYLYITEVEPTPRSKKIKVPLIYNRATKLLEGEDEDNTIVPRAGEPRPKRSALAVVAEYALKELRTTIQPETQTT